MALHLLAFLWLRMERRAKAATTTKSNDNGVTSVRRNYLWLFEHAAAPSSSSPYKSCATDTVCSMMVNECRLKWSMYWLLAYVLKFNWQSKGHEVFILSMLWTTIVIFGWLFCTIISRLTRSLPLSQWQFWAFNWYDCVRMYTKQLRPHACNES